LIIHTFYAGINVKNRDLLDLLTNGSFTEYGVDKAWNLLEAIHKDELSKYSKELDEKSLVE
jgi:predicted HAD superfamily Cof-like phosphohydrolase